MKLMTLRGEIQEQEWITLFLGYFPEELGPD